MGFKVDKIPHSCQKMFQTDNEKFHEGKFNLHLFLYDYFFSLLTFSSPVFQKTQKQLSNKK